MSNSILKATCDKILAIAPAPEKEMEKIGDIIIPEAAMAGIKAKMAQNPMQVLEIAAAGPDCKVARKGLRVIVNKHHYNDATVEHEGVHYACFSEVTAFAILAPAEVQGGHIPVAPVRPSIAEVKKAAGLEEKPTDDRDALPPAASTAPAA